jgi:hypothetical protein
MLESKRTTYNHRIPWRKHAGRRILVVDVDVRATPHRFPPRSSMSRVRHQSMWASSISHQAVLLRQIYTSEYRYHPLSGALRRMWDRACGPRPFERQWRQGLTTVAMAEEVNNTSLVAAVCFPHGILDARTRFSGGMEVQHRMTPWRGNSLSAGHQHPWLSITIYALTWISVLRHDCTYWTKHIGGRNDGRWLPEFPHHHVACEDARRGWCTVTWPTGSRSANRLVDRLADQPRSSTTEQGSVKLTSVLLRPTPYSCSPLPLEHLVCHRTKLITSVLRLLCLSLLSSRGLVRRSFSCMR